MKRLIFPLIITVVFMIPAKNAHANISMNGTSDDDSSKIEQVTVKITGMHCGGCSAAINNALLKKDGVLGSSASYPGDVASIVYIPSKIGEKDIIKAIRKMGYKVAKIEEDDDDDDDDDDDKTE